MKQTGFRSVRIDVPWAVLEPTRGRIDWSCLDAVVATILEEGMCPLGVVGMTPEWARPARYRGLGHTVAPRSADEFAAFVRAAAARYRGRMLGWEIWNEPNIATHFKPAPDVAAYSTLLAKSYAAVKSVAPDAIVLSGGLAPAVDGAGTIAPRTFVDRLYRHAPRLEADALAIHPYSWPALPTDPSTAAWNCYLAMPDIRDTMVAHGDRAKRVWITEVGAPTGRAPKAVSEAMQAQIIVEAVTPALHTGWVGPIYLYSMRDSGTNVFDPEQNFGLLHRDFSPKYGYTGIKDGIASLPSTW